MSRGTSPTPLAEAGAALLLEGLRSWLHRMRTGPAPYHPPTDLCERVLGAVEALSHRAFSVALWGDYVRVDDGNADDAFALLVARCAEVLKDPRHAPLNDVGMPGSDVARASLASVVASFASKMTTLTARSLKITRASGCASV